MASFTHGALIAALALSLVAARDARADEPAPLEVAIRSAIAGEQFSAWVGPGPATVPPPRAVEGDHMSAILSIEADDGKTYGYMAKEVRAKRPRAIMLEVSADVTNPADKEQPFRLLDVSVGGEDVVLAGAGSGRIAFVKGKDVWKKIAKTQKPEMIPPGETRKYTYLFELPKADSSWMITYAGEPVAKVDVGQKVAGSKNADTRKVVDGSAKNPVQ
jgi:hypothetical protein